MTVEIRNESGETLAVSLTPDGNRECASVMVAGVRHHFERVRRTEMLSAYTLDTDPDYDPQTDSDGCCYLLVPYGA